MIKQQENRFAFSVDRNIPAEIIANKIWYETYHLRAGSALTANLLVKFIKLIDAPLSPPIITDEVLEFVRFADMFLHQSQPRSSALC